MKRPEVSLETNAAGALPFLPRHLRNWAYTTDQHIVPNATCFLQLGADIPAAIRSKIAFKDALKLEPPIIWLRDVTNAIFPIGLEPYHIALLQDLQSTPQEQLRSPELHAALILGSKSALDQRAAVLSGQIERSRYAKDSVAICKSIFPPLVVAQMRKHYRRLVKDGLCCDGDPQCMDRLSLHNERFSKYLQHQICEYVSAIVGRCLKPSYTFFAAYHNKAVLKPHRDREQCFVTVSVLLDYVPEPDLESPWPIGVDFPHGKITVNQAIGDTLIFDGVNHQHYRPALAENHLSSSLFLHYVPVEFEGPLN